MTEAQRAAFSAMNFDPRQPRDRRGQWTDGFPGAGGDQSRERLASRVAGLRASIDSGVESTTEMGQGSMSEVRRLHFADGSDGVAKTVKKGANGLNAADTVRSEVLMASVAAALGVRAPAVIRTGPKELVAELVEGESGTVHLLPAGGYVRGGPRIDVARQDALMGSPDGTRLGLMDALTNQQDRHDGNWIVDPRGNLVAIDNGLAFAEPRSANPFESAAYNRFVSTHFAEGMGRLKANPLTPADVEVARERLEALRPEFVALKREKWLDTALERLELLGRHATGTRDLLAGGALTACDAMAFNPRQPRDGDGRWAKTGGGSQAASWLILPRGNMNDTAAAQVEQLFGFEDPQTGMRAELRGARMSGGLAVITLDIVDRDGNLVGSASRGIYRDEEADELIVTHGSLTLDEKMRAGGFSSRWLREMERRYRGQGISQIELATANVGGYAWAKAGFDFSNDRQASQTADSVAIRLSDEQLSPSVYQELGDLLNRAHAGGESRPTPMEFAMLGWTPGAESWPGKRAMLGSSWLGVKRLNEGGPAITAATSEQQAAFAAMAYNPRQRRGLDGRWVKGGGLGAATPREALDKGVKSGIADRRRLSGGAMAAVELVEFNNGSKAVRKSASAQLGRSAKDQTDAEVLAGKIAQALGVKTPEILRVSDTVIFMEYEQDDQPAIAWMRPADVEKLATTPQGIQMGLLDLLIANPDRHGGNYLVSDNQQTITAIDHGFAWEDLEDYYPSVFANSNFKKDHPVSRATVEALRPKIEALRADFEQSGHLDWYDQMAETFEWVAQRAADTDVPAGGSPAITAATSEQLAAFATLAFNPDQKRAPDGRWGDGLAPRVPVPRGGRGRLRPTASDSAKLPEQPPLKAAPRAAIFTDGWMHSDDPGGRAAGFWQGRFGDQRTIRQAFRNIAAEREPLDGIDLDRGFNMTYLRVAPNSDDEGRVYDKADLANDLTSAARWLHESLAAAPVSTAPLYRGLRMDRADVPKVGDSWDSDIVSWAEDRGWAEVYAGMEEDPGLGRVGKTEVVLRLSGPKRSVDLGAGHLDEHLTQGRYRVTKVTGSGNRRFVTVEEVSE